MQGARVAKALIAPYTLSQRFLKLTALKGNHMNAHINQRVVGPTLSILFCVLSIQPLNARTLLMIEGNTGAGKTTLSRLIEREFDALIIEEPTVKWRNVGDKGNLLDLHLNHRKRWGYTFQNYACFTFMQACVEADPSYDLHVCDRSAYSGIYCFSRMMLEEGTLTDLEYYLYKEQFEWLVELLSCKPDGFIYIRTAPSNCLRRSCVRQRPEEAALSTKDFFDPLHRFHEEWLVEKLNVPASLARVPVLILNGDLDFKSDPDIQRVYVDQIRDFLEVVKEYKETI